MKSEPKFFVCDICGNMVGKIYDSGVKMVCCGQEMTEMVANTVDASYEAHLPVIEAKEREITVRVGSKPHPMIPEHFIGWVYIHTEKGGQRKNLAAGDEPVVKFQLTEEDSLISAFAYCNLHGLWKTAFDKK